MTFKTFLATGVLSLAAGGTLLPAQGIITGSLAGSVQDPTGAVVPGATIVATSVKQGVDYKAAANTAGEFTLSSLPPGEYTVTIQSAGFGDLKLEHVLVATGNTTGLGVEKLQTGSAVETVSVSTASAILETTQAQVTTTFDSQQITDLPTGGRLDSLTLLVPGVVRTLSDNFSNTNGAGFSSNGQRGRSNNFELDGQSNNDNSIAGPQVFFRNEDAIQELQIITNNFSAQYGRNMGSVVNYVTKSGANSFHGTGFENYLGSWGSSLTQGQKGTQFGFCAPGQVSATGAACTAVSVPRVTANEFGGTFGGPIFRDKLFFFGGTLWRKITNGAAPSISTTLTPTPAGLTQLASLYPNNPFVTSLINQGPYSVTLGNPSPVGTPILTTVCPSANTCPAGSPQVPFSAIQRFLPSHSQDQEHIGRGDYQFTPHDRFFLRYFYQDAPTYVSGGTVSTGAYYDNFDTAHSVGADWTHTFSSRWVNQLRYSFQQTKLVFGGGGYPACANSTISSCPANIVFGGGTYAGYGPATNIPQGRIVKSTQAQDNATWNFGKHNITFGGEYDYQNSPNVFLPSTSGAYNFPNFNSYLAGGCSSGCTLGLANGNPTIPFTEPDVAAYFQDDWKVTRSLTLNLGMRWEFFKQSVNLLHDITVSRQNGPNAIWNTSLPQSLTTEPYVPQNYKNFEPRFGFAFAPTTRPSLVVRGGFAINYDPQFYNLFLNIYQYAPVVNTATIQCTGGTVQCLPGGGTINSLVHQLNDPASPTGVNPGTKIESYVGSKFKNPYSENYTLGVQYQATRFAVAEVRYVGNHTIGNFQSLNGNPGLNIAPPSITTTTGTNVVTSTPLSLSAAFPGMFPAPAACPAGSPGVGRPDCNRSTVLLRANTAFSIYNAVQTTFTVRDYHGISGTAAYTFSRTIDNSSEAYGTAGGGNTIAYSQNPLETNVSERGLSGNSYPNVASLGLSYAPHLFKSDRTLVGRTLGGFQFNTIYTFNSGQPYTPYQSTRAAINPTALGRITLLPANLSPALYSFCDNGFNQNIIGNDSCRPILSNPNAPAGTVGINAGPGLGYLDTSTGASINPNQVKWLVNNQYEALARNNPFPGVGRNTLKGNSVNELDASIFKNVSLTERVTTQFRINVFNLPNRAYYGTPDAFINDYNPAVHNPQYSSFETFKSMPGTIVGSPFGKGMRNIEIGGKILF